MQHHAEPHPHFATGHTQHRWAWAGKVDDWFLFFELELAATALFVKLALLLIFLGWGGGVLKQLLRWKILASPVEAGALLWLFHPHHSQTLQRLPAIFHLRDAHVYIRCIVYNVSCFFIIIFLISVAAVMLLISPLWDL